MNTLLQFDAPNFLVRYTNNNIMKLIYKLDQNINSSHYYKTIHNSSLTIFQLYEILLMMAMDATFTFTIDEVRKRKHIAYAIYFLIVNNL